MKGLEEREREEEQEMKGIGDEEKVGQGDRNVGSGNRVQELNIKNEVKGKR